MTSLRAAPVTLTTTDAHGAKHEEQYDLIPDIYLILPTCYHCYVINTHRLPWSRI